MDNLKEPINGYQYQIYPSYPNYIPTRIAKTKRLGLWAKSVSNQARQKISTMFSYDNYLVKNYNPRAIKCD